MKQITSLLVGGEIKQFLIMIKTTTMFLQVDFFELWERRLSKNRLAIAILNNYEIGYPREFLISSSPTWKYCTKVCNVTQILPTYQELGIQTPTTNLTVKVKPSGTALLIIAPLNKASWDMDKKTLKKGLFGKWWKKTYAVKNNNSF